MIAWLVKRFACWCETKWFSWQDRPDLLLDDETRYGRVFLIDDWSNE